MTEGEANSCATAAGELQNEKLALDIENQRLTNLKLRQDISHVGKLMALAAPSISMIAAIAAIVISVWTQQNQSAYQSKSDQHKALDAALESVGAKDSPTRQLSGVYQLSSLWHIREDELVVGATLTAMLSVDGDANRNLRCAAAEAIGQSITDEDLRTNDLERTRRITKLLYGFGDEGSWGMVAHANFLLARLGIEQEHGANSLGTYACGSSIDATKEAMRKSWRYLEHVNFQRTDLSRTPFYEADLAHAMMMGANLAAANLRCANLFGADLRFAKLEPDTILTLANVKGVVSEGVNFSNMNLVINIDDADWHVWASSGFSGKKLLELTHGSPSEQEISAVVGGKIQNVEVYCQNGKL